MVAVYCEKFVILGIYYHQCILISDFVTEGNSTAVFELRLHCGE